MHMLLFSAGFSPIAVISVAVAMAVIYFLPLISRGEYDVVYIASQSGVSHTQAQADSNL